MHKLVKDLTGKMFGRLTVIQYLGPNSTSHTYWRCKCSCGNVTDISGSSIRRGASRSCGCLRQELLTTHGLTKHPDYKIWKLMMQRCHKPNDQNYPDYGGRGIEVCKRWRESPANFFEDMGPRPQGLSIDRKNNELGYFKENCRWTDMRTQNGNRRSCIQVTYRGKTQCLTHWARERGMRDDTLARRLKAGWNLKEALETPVGPACRRKSD